MPCSRILFQVDDEVLLQSEGYHSDLTQVDENRVQTPLVCERNYGEFLPHHKEKLLTNSSRFGRSLSDSSVAPSSISDNLDNLSEVAKETEIFFDALDVTSLTSHKNPGGDPSNFKFTDEHFAATNPTFVLNLDSLEQNSCDKSTGIISNTNLGNTLYQAPTDRMGTGIDNFAFSGSYSQCSSDISEGSFGRSQTVNGLFQSDGYRIPVSEKTPSDALPSRPRCYSESTNYYTEGQKPSRITPHKRKSDSFNIASNEGISLFSSVQSNQSYDNLSQITHGGSVKILPGQRFNADDFNHSNETFV